MFQSSFSLFLFRSLFLFLSHAQRRPLKLLSKTKTKISAAPLTIAAEQRNPLIQLAIVAEQRRPLVEQ
jgi:hypothetical protein